MWMISLFTLDDMLEVVCCFDIVTLFNNSILF